MLSRLLLVAGLTGLLAGCGALAVPFLEQAGVGWLCVLAAVAVLVLARKGRGIWTAYGTAAWESLAGLMRKGCLSGRGFPVGRFAGSGGLWPAVKLLLFAPPWRSGVSCRMFFAALGRKSVSVRLPKAVHTAVFATAGAGKTTGLVIPFLLSEPDSMVVIDPKGELAKLTAGHRRRMGHEVHSFDPHSIVTEAGNSACFNTFDMVSDDPRELYGDAQELANAFVVATGKEHDQFWNDSARFEIASGIVYAAKFLPRGLQNIQSVRTILADPGLRKQAMEQLIQAGAQDEILGRLGGQMAQLTDKTLGTVQATVGRFLQFLDNPALVETLSSSSYDVLSMKRKKQTVYICSPAHRMQALSGLVRMLLSAHLRAVVRAGLGEERKVQFVCEEAALLGNMECVQEALAQYRGFGVRMSLIYQSMGQLAACWPDGKDQVLLSNTTQVMFGIRDMKSAEYVSGVVGEATQVVASGGTNSSGSSSHNSSSTYGSQPSYSAGWTHSNSWGSNSNWQQAGRKLLKPEEVIALPADQAIVLTPGLKPLRTTLVPYWKDPDCGGLLGRLRGSLAVFVKSAAVCACGLMFLVVALHAAGLLGSRPERQPRPDPFVAPLGGQDPFPFQPVR